MRWCLLPALAAAIYPIDRRFQAPPDSGVQVWACGGAGGGSQAWALRAAPGTSFSVLAQEPRGWVLTVPGASNASGVQLGVAPLPSGTGAPPAAQLWSFSGGLLRSALNGRCAAPSDPVAGALVYLLPCNSSDAAQAWALGGNGTLAQPGSGCLDVGGALNCTAPSLRGALYCNASAPAAARAADLAARLSIHDLRLLLGGWYESAGVPRLGLRRFSFAEALHGLGAPCGRPFSNASYTTSGCASSFPHATLLAAAFNRSLWAAVGGAISTEARAAKGGLLLWTPDINLSRDQRWGRAQEVPGECPLLTGEYAAAFVAGLQAAAGAAPGAPLRAVATCKHWHSYDFEGGWGNLTRHTFDARVGFKDLVEYYTAPFRACVQRGGAAAVMSSINSVNGVPSAASANFTVRLLRGQWGANAFVTSDCGTVADIERTHHYAATPLAAVADAVRGGTDFNCGNFKAPGGAIGAGYYNAYLQQTLEGGLVTLGELQGAAARLLSAVARLGLLEGGEGPYAQWGPERIDTPAHRQLALEGAKQGAVLLRNEGGVLPLQLRALRTLAVVGPHGNMSSAMLANYAGSNTLVAENTPLLRLRARAAPAGVSVTFAQGLPSAHSNDTSGVPGAAAAAAAADAAVLFLGLDQTLEREGLDRLSLSLPPAQAALLRAVSAATNASGTPLVAVLVGGGAISEAANGARALVAAFYPGELGGEALAQLLLGEAHFSGRLPITVYAPGYDALREPTDMALAPHGAVPGATYWYTDAAHTLFPFGAGLSSGGPFALEWAGRANATVDAAAWARGEAPPPAWAVRVRSAAPQSAAPADVSVLGFVEPGGAPGGPRVKLFDFSRAAAVPPGGAASVSLAMPVEAVAAVDDRGTRTLLPGLYRLRLGGDAAGGAGNTGAPLEGWLQVTGAPTVVDSLPF
jgi:beta-D-xylosidase 4